MAPRQISDWSILGGASVEMREPGGTVICSGIVDAVTEDGAILWLQSPTEGRRLFEKADGYQAWAVEDRAAFHYWVSMRLHLGPYALSRC